MRARVCHGVCAPARVHVCVAATVCVFTVCARHESILNQCTPECVLVYVAYDVCVCVSVLCVCTRVHVCLPASMTPFGAARSSCPELSSLLQSLMYRVHTCVCTYICIPLAPISDFSDPIFYQCMPEQYGSLMPKPRRTLTHSLTQLAEEKTMKKKTTDTFYTATYAHVN